MKRDLLMLLFFAILTAVGYYFYQEKYAEKAVISMENSLEAICNQVEEDFSEAEEGLEA